MRTYPHDAVRTSYTDTWCHRRVWYFAVQVADLPDVVQFLTFVVDLILTLGVGHVTGSALYCLLIRNYSAQEG